MTLNENLVAVTEKIADAIHDDRCAIADLQDQLEAEEQARIECCTTLTTALDNERAARIAGDAELDGKLDAERQARMDGDTALGQRIDLLRDGLDAEADARVAADELLSERILAEVAARASGDAQLSDRLTVETLNRENADDDLQAQIDKLKGSSAVIDVVATKAALNAYPTTDLTDNDIIFVKTDESAPAAERNAMAFYRYSTATGQWSLVFRITPKELADRISNTLDSANPDYSTMLADAILNLLVEALGDKLSALSQQLQAAIAAAVADAINRDDALAKRIADLLKIALGLPVILEGNKNLYVATNGNDYPTYQTMINAGLMTAADIPGGQTAGDTAKDAILIVYKWGTTLATAFRSIQRAASLAATHFNLGPYTVNIIVKAGNYHESLQLGSQTRTTGGITIQPYSSGGNWDAVTLYYVHFNGGTINISGIGNYTINRFNIVKIDTDQQIETIAHSFCINMSGSSICTFNRCNLYALNALTTPYETTEVKHSHGFTHISDNCQLYIGENCNFIATHLGISGSSLVGDSFHASVNQYGIFSQTGGMIQFHRNDDASLCEHAMFGYVDHVIHSDNGSTIMPSLGASKYYFCFKILTDASSMPPLVISGVHIGSGIYTVNLQPSQMPPELISRGAVYEFTGSSHLRDLQKYMPGSKLKVTDNVIDESYSDPRANIRDSDFSTASYHGNNRSNYDYLGTVYMYPANITYNPSNI